MANTSEYTLKEIPSFRVVSATLRGKPAEVAKQSQRKIIEWAHKVASELPIGLGPQRIAGVKGLSVYSVSEDYWKACLPISQDIFGSGEINLDHLKASTGLDTKIEYTPGGTYAVFQHKGSYSGLAHAASSIKPSLSSWNHKDILELYLNDSEQVAEKDLVTEICFPV